MESRIEDRDQPTLSYRYIESFAKWTEQVYVSLWASCPRIQNNRFLVELGPAA